jgi:hypothetical protein
MKMLENIGKLFIILLTVSGLASCNDDPETAPFEAIGDVSLMKRMINDEIRYTRMYYVYANQPMASAEVALPEGGSLTLDPADQTKQTYFYEPSVMDYTTTVPTLGLFDFSVVNEDIEHVITESASSNDLGFATIDTVSVNNNMVHIEWQSVDGADAFQIRLVDENYNVLFSGDLLNSAQSVYEFTPTQPLETGQNYRIEVNTYSFEQDAGTSYLYNFEEIAISSFEVTWQ